MPSPFVNLRLLYGQGGASPMQPDYGSNDPDAGNSNPDEIAQELFRQQLAKNGLGANNPNAAMGGGPGDGPWTPTPDVPGLKRPGDPSGTDFVGNMPDPNSPGLRLAQDQMQEGARHNLTSPVDPQAAMRKQGLLGAAQGFFQALGTKPHYQENFGQTLGRTAGAVTAGAVGSMNTLRDRQQQEEDRHNQIENTFFTRSIALQKLRQGESNEEDKDAIQKGRLGVSQQNANTRTDVAQQGTIPMDRARTTSLEAGTVLDNAKAADVAPAAQDRRTRANKPSGGGAGKAVQAPMSEQDIDAAGKQAAYQRYGALDQTGKISPGSKSLIDRQLQQKGSRRNNVQQEYDKAVAPLRKRLKTGASKGKNTAQFSGATNPTNDEQ